MIQCAAVRMPALGQNSKYQLRANVFRYAPYERTSTGTNVMSEKCHFRTLALRQKRLLDPSSACAGNAAHRLSRRGGAGGAPRRPRRGACAHHPVERADRGARYEAHLNEIARNKLDEAATARTCTATKCAPLQRSVRRGFKARATLP